MQLKKISPLLFLLAVILFISSCRESKDTTTATNHNNVLSEAYYMQFKSSEQRLAQLMSGTFSCYWMKRNALMEVNNGKDSVIVYALTVGDPNKDGTWVYKESFMTNFPERPLMQLFQHIKRESPDSLTIYEYIPKDKENKYIGYHTKAKRPINIKDFTPTGCVVGVRKLAQTSFLCSIDMCERKTNVKGKWTELKAMYTPKGIELDLIVYPSPDKRAAAKTATRSWLFFRRLIEE